MQNGCENTRAGSSETHDGSRGAQNGSSGTHDQTSGMQNPTSGTRTETPGTQNPTSGTQDESTAASSPRISTRVDCAVRRDLPVQIRMTSETRRWFMASRVPLQKHDAHAFLRGRHRLFRFWDSLECWFDSDAAYWRRRPRPHRPARPSSARPPGAGTGSTWKKLVSEIESIEVRVNCS